MIDRDVFVEQAALVAAGDPTIRELSKQPKHSKSHQMQIAIQTDSESQQHEEESPRNQEAFSTSLPQQATAPANFNNDDNNNTINNIINDTHPENSVDDANCYTGVDVNVSNEGWFVWFKNLGLPSPVSQARVNSSSNGNSIDSSHRDGTDQQQRMARDANDDGDTPTCHNDDATLRSSDSTSSDVTSALASGKDRKTGSIATQSTIATTDSIESSTNQQSTQEEEKQTLVGCLPKTKHAVRTSAYKVNQKVFIPLGASFKNGWIRFKQWVQKHPRISIAILVLFLLFILILLLIVFLVIIPNKIQRAIDQTVLDLAHAKISDPSDDSFTIEVESNIKRTLGTPVTLKEFEATVRYAPTFSFQSQYRELLDSQSDGTITPQQQGDELIIRSGRNQPRASGMYHTRNPSNANNSGEVHRLLVEFENASHHDSRMTTTSSNTRGRQLQEATEAPLAHTNNSTLLNEESGEKIYYNLGQMVIPDQTISGLTSTTSYTSTFEVLDSQLFEIFLKELMTLGHSDWVILGHPSVKVMGLTFHGTLFEKPMPVHGPKLHITREEFISMMVDTMQVNETAEAPWWEDVGSDDKVDHVNEGRDEGSTVKLPNVTMPLVDLTISTEDVVRLHLQVEMNNEGGMSTVDPVGAMTLQSQYRGQPMVELTSKEETILKPGANVVDFFGEFVRLDQSTEQRREAMTDLFSRMFRGDSPLLETTGIASSIPLFTPAIETIHLYTFLELLKGQNRDNEDDNGGSSGGIPIVQDMKLETLQLIENPNDSSEVGIRGRLFAVIGNPLGANSSIEVPLVKLVGQMLTPESNSTEENGSGTGGGTTVKKALGFKGQDEGGEGRQIMADFYGTLQGAGKGRQIYGEDGHPVMGQMGAMPVSIQTIEFDMNFVLKLLNGGLGFQKFVQVYIREKALELSLVNVTATVSTMSALGPLELRDVPMDQDVQLIGLNGLQDVKLAHFSIESIPYLTSTGDEGFNIEVGVVIPSEAAADIYLGTLFVDLRFQGSHLAFMTAPRCRIAPGENLFNFTGQARLKEIELTKMLAFTRNYINGRGNTVEVELISSIPDRNMTQDLLDGEDVLAPEWLRYALVGLTLEVQVPGARMMNNNGNGILGNGGLLGFGLLGGGRRSSNDAALGQQEASGQDEELSGMASENHDGSTSRSRGGLIGGLFNGILNGAQTIANVARGGGG